MCSSSMWSVQLCMRTLVWGVEVKQHRWCALAVHIVRTGGVHRGGSAQVVCSVAFTQRGTQRGTVHREGRAQAVCTGGAVHRWWGKWALASSSATLLLFLQPHPPLYLLLALSYFISHCCYQLVHLVVKWNVPRLLKLNRWTFPTLFILYPTLFASL